MDKRARVVMLPTNEKADGKMYSSMIAKEKGKLYNWSNPNYSYDKATFHHLYTTSDDKIEDCDWCILFDDFGNVMSAPQQYLKTKGHVLNSGLKKIIATTDSSLNIHWNGQDHKSLPQPTQSFIQKFVEEYNKGNIITDVMVEYTLLEYATPLIDSNTGNEIPQYTLKLSKDNTITIKRVKDSWSRDEVVELIREAITTEYLMERDEKWMGDVLDCVFYNINEEEFNQWIEENL